MIGHSLQVQGVLLAADVFAAKGDRRRGLQGSQHLGRAGQTPWLGMTGVMKFISSGQRLKEAPTWCLSKIVKRSQPQVFEYDATADTGGSGTHNHNVIGLIRLGLGSR